MSQYRSYSELIKIPSFEARYEYLRLSSSVGEATFGFDRYLSQQLYASYKWKKLRQSLIIRDNGFDMAHLDNPISGSIFLHHLNPLTLQDLEDDRPCIYDPENLVCVSFNTHNAIHFGDSNLLPKPFVERSPYDTCPWKL